MYIAVELSRLSELSTLLCFRRRAAKVISIRITILGLALSQPVVGQVSRRAGVDVCRERRECTYRNLVPCQQPTYSGLEGKQNEGKDEEKKGEEKEEEKAEAEEEEGLTRAKGQTTGTRTPKFPSVHKQHRPFLIR